MSQTSIHSKIQTSWVRRMLHSTTLAVIIPAFLQWSAPDQSVHKVQGYSAKFFSQTGLTPQPNAAVDLPHLTPEEQQEGWRLLFDGHTTQGWRGYHRKDFPPTGWSIQDGCLVVAQTDGRPGHSGGDLVTVDSFEDFDLQWEWRISPGGNSGIYYFMHEREQPGPPMYRGDDGTAAVGHEYQMLDDDTHPDGKIPSHTTASLYDVFAPVNKVLKPVGEFNQSRIVVNGQVVQHWLNGVKVVEYRLDSQEYRDAVAQSKFKAFLEFAPKYRAPLLLQDHGCAVWFRNLKIRDLSAAK